jgi:hypothetical protein
MVGRDRRLPLEGDRMDVPQLQEFGTKYTAAWCSQNARNVAAFFAEGGSLTAPPFCDCAFRNE